MNNKVLINLVNKKESLLPETQKEMINLNTTDNEKDENIGDENVE